MKHKSTITMQKTWSILNESDSPNSASSTDANYSSPSGGNSSDDSNCSNQTNYSMSTGVMASPPALSGSSSSSPISTSSNSSGDSPPPLSTQQLQQQQLQQHLLHQQQQQQQPQQLQQLQQPQQQPTPQSIAPPIPPPTSVTVTAKENKENPPFNYVTTPQLAETTLQRIRQRYCTPPDNNGNNSESAMRSLELLRMTIQSSFDKDIDVIIRRYVETYFKPAFSNIKENLGDTAVSEEVLQKMSCALLENAKSQYHGIRIRSAQSLYSQQDAAPPPSEPNEPVPVPVRAGVKRHITTSVSSSVTNTNTTVSIAHTPPQKRAFSSVTTKTPTTMAAVTTTAAPAVPTTTTSASLPQTTSSERRGVVSSAPLPPSNFQPFRGTALPNPPATNAANNARRQIIWNTANVSTSTKFVLDVQANQAFGFGTDGRERLASKHPELIRYLPDTEDRNWLIAQHIISQHNRNSRFLFLVHDEVCNLMQNDAYRTKPNINLTVMRTFSVPEFMIDKMRHFFIDLNIKSRGLITTSTNNANVQQSGTKNATGNSNNSANSVAAPNKSITINSTATTTTTTFSGNSGSSSSSQLRTALLQGQAVQQPSQLSLFNEDTLMSNASSDYVTTTSTLNDTPNVANFSAAFQQPARTSALSSTHATLTALLNNSNSPGVPPPLSRVFSTTQICTGRGGVTLQVTSSAAAAAAKSNAATAYVTSSGLNRSNAAQTTTSSHGSVGRGNAAVATTTKTAQSSPYATLGKNVTIVHTTSNGQGKQNIVGTIGSMGAVTISTAANRNNATSITTVNTARANATAASIAASSSGGVNISNSGSRGISLQQGTLKNNSITVCIASSNTSATRNINSSHGIVVNRSNSVGSSTGSTITSIPIRNPIRNSRATSNRK